MLIEQAKSSKLETFYGPIRFEDGPWSLLRVDKGLKYGLKSLCHRPNPATDADRQHFERSFDFLKHESWRSARCPSQRSLSLACVGDLMWLEAGWDAPVSSRVRERLNGSSIRYANLETPIDSDKPVPFYSYCRFNAPESYLSMWEEDSSKTIFSLCNNHALDQGARGLVNTRKAVLEKQRFHCVGGVDAADRISVVEHDGLTIASIGVTYGINPWSVDGSSHVPDGICLSGCGNPNLEPNWSELSALIQRCRELQADFIVVLAHWGFEYEYWPEARQREFAYRLIEMGADLIVGSSPHVLQPIEVVSVDGWNSTCSVQLERGGAPRPGIIAYSLGNFTTSMPTTGCRTGAVLELEVGFDADGSVGLHDLGALPTASIARGLTRRSRQTVALSELPECSARPYQQHARRLLGPLMRQF